MDKAGNSSIDISIVSEGVNSSENKIGLAYGFAGAGIIAAAALGIGIMNNCKKKSISKEAKEEVEELDTYDLIEDLDDNSMDVSLEDLNSNLVDEIIQDLDDDSMDKLVNDMVKEAEDATVDELINEPVNALVEEEKVVEPKIDLVYIKERMMENSSKYQAKTRWEKTTSITESQKISALENLLYERKPRLKNHRWEVYTRRKVLRNIQNVALSSLQSEVQKLFDKIRKINNEITKKRVTIEIIKRERKKKNIVTEGEMKRKRFETYQEPKKKPKNYDLEQIERTVESEEENCAKTEIVIKKINRKIRNLLNKSDRFLPEDIEMLEKAEKEIAQIADGSQFENRDMIAEEFKSLIEELKERKEEDQKSQLNSTEGQNPMISPIGSFNMAIPGDKWDISGKNQMDLDNSIESLTADTVIDPNEFTESTESTEMYKFSEFDELADPVEGPAFSNSVENDKLVKSNDSTGLFSLTKSTEARVRSLDLSSTLSIGSSVGSLGEEKNTRNRDLTDEDTDRLIKKKIELTKRLDRRQVQLKELTDVISKILKIPEEREEERRSKIKFKRKYEY